MNPGLAYCILALLVSSAFTLATLIEPRSDAWSKRAQSGGFLSAVFGEGRRLFANHFFTQADVYFHSGYYPSIFDQQPRPKGSEHMTDTDSNEHGEHCDEAHHDHDDHSDHEPTQTAESDGVDHKSEHYKQMALQKPRDWVEAFGRKFTVTSHTHLSGGNEREMLPWLKLSAEMDPQRIDTYTVAAYWLSKMGKFKEAEDFLRLGLKNNPESYEILFELGAVLEQRKDDVRAANLWRMALRRWHQQEDGKEEPDKIGHERIVLRLAKLEERNGNIPAAVGYLRLALKTSPRPENVKEQIDALTSLVDKTGTQEK